MITLNNLNFGFGHENILNDISFTINDGDFLLVVGPNGTGKSTLIKCLLGINKVKHNQIQIDDQCISCFNDYHQIGYVPQIKTKPSELPITPNEIFKLITKDKDKISKLTKLLNIESIVNKNINNLSGGQKQRVNIAKAMLLDIKYLILDEPSTGLDLQSRNELQSTLTTLRDTGVTIIIVSHHEDEVSDLITCKFDIANNHFERMTNA